MYANPRARFGANNNVCNANPRARCWPLLGLISIHETETNSETDTKFKFLSRSVSIVFLFFDNYQTV